MEHTWKSATGIWLLLSIATIVTTWGLSKDGLDPAIATCFIFVIAGWKVRLVLLQFMELKEAPWPLRLAFEAWVLIVSGLILAFYFQAPGAGA